MSDILVEQLTNLETGVVFAWKKAEWKGYTLYKVLKHFPSGNTHCVDLSGYDIVSFESCTWVKVKIEVPS